MTLAEGIIRTRIAEAGAISVAEFMEIALQHPQHGYYRTQTAIGKAADFITAPEISQVFGELIGAWLIECWSLAQLPHEIALVELGPGRAALMQDILRVLKRHAPFFPVLEVHLVESNRTLRDHQQSILQEYMPRCSWHDSIDTLPPKPLLLIANEFFDALPIKQFIACPEWHERVIVEKNGKLAFESGEPATHNNLPVSPTPGEIAEQCEAAISIVQQLCRHVCTHRGVALCIDYGYREGYGDTLQAIKRHQMVDVFDSIGEADLTAHVNFGALSATAGAAGVHSSAITDQGDFLTRLGAEIRTQMLAQRHPKQADNLLQSTNRLIDKTQMGSLFKCLALSDRAIDFPGM